MDASKSLATTRNSRLAASCRYLRSPAIPHDDDVSGQRGFRLFGPEPVNIYSYAGERVVYHSHHHWCVPLIDTLEMTTVMAVVAVFSVLIDLLPFDLWWLQAIMWVATLGHTAWMSRHLLRWRVGLIIVTNWRLIRTGGLFSTGVKSYRFDTVGNCYRLTSFLGRIFGFCTVRIVQNGGLHNQGADDEYLARVPRRTAEIIEFYVNKPPVTAVIPHLEHPHHAHVYGHGQEDAA